MPWRSFRRAQKPDSAFFFAIATASCCTSLKPAVMGFEGAHPGVHGFGHKIHELLIGGMRLFYVLFGHVTQRLRDFEWGFSVITSSPGTKVQKCSRSRGSSYMTK